MSETVSSSRQKHFPEHLLVTARGERCTTSFDYLMPGAALISSSVITSKIAIIGSGPTGIYTLRGLVTSVQPLFIDVYEAESPAGIGTPYHPDINDRAMLANIASIELPPIKQSLVEWLERQTDQSLDHLGVLRSNIHEREFYPRVVIGEYLKAQFDQLIEQGRNVGHQISVKQGCRVTDLQLLKDSILLTADTSNADHHKFYDHVVMATGHTLPENTEKYPGYFISPWPATALKQIEPCKVGILGTSLSAIDALVSVSTAHGNFYYDASGALCYASSSDGSQFSAVMMSRKGILPEADFYCEFPYAPLRYCTHEAVAALVTRSSENLLDNIFELFRRELAECDPEYAEKINLLSLTVESIASAYFKEREEADPFVWAATNLLEAIQNKQARHTIPWRYAILRMHEVIGRAVPSLNTEDLRRFHKHLKSIFVDDYATVPHQSIERLMALRKAGKLEVHKLGSNYKINTRSVFRGAEVITDGERLKFAAFIDATGERPMSSDDLPFPSLVAQDVIKKSSTAVANGFLEDDQMELSRTGSIDLDDAFRPKILAPLSNKLYCVAISFLLHKLPFVQGITSAYEMGVIVSSAIISDISGQGLGKPPSGLIITDQ